MRSFFRPVLSGLLVASLLGLAGAAFLASPARADLFDFTNGAGTGDWETDLNWIRVSPDPPISAVPGVGDDATLNYKTATKQGGAIDLASLTLDHATLTLTGGVNLHTTAASLTASTLAFAGAGNQVGGSLTLLNSALQVDVTKGASDVTLNAGTSITFTGVPTGIGPSFGGVQGKATVTNNGALRFNSSGQGLYSDNYLAADDFTNHGTVDAPSLNVYGPVVNAADGVMTVVGQQFGDALTVSQGSSQYNEGNRYLKNDGLITVTGAALNLGRQGISGTGTTHLTDVVISAVKDDNSFEGGFVDQTVIADGSTNLYGDTNALILNRATLTGNGLTLSGDARLECVGLENVISNQNLQFGQGGGRIYVNPAQDAPATLTLTPEARLTGEIASIRRTFTNLSSMSLVNQGTIIAGGIGLLDTFVAFDNVRNEGVLTADLQDRMHIVARSGVTNAAGATLSAGDGATISVERLTASKVASVVNDGSIILNGGQSPASFVVNSVSGFTNNGTITADNGLVQIGADTSAGQGALDSFTNNGTIDIDQGDLFLRDDVGSGFLPNMDNNGKIIIRTDGSAPATFHLGRNRMNNYGGVELTTTGGGPNKATLVTYQGFLRYGALTLNDARVEGYVLLTREATLNGTGGGFTDAVEFRGGDCHVAIDRLMFELPDFSSLNVYGASSFSTAVTINANATLTGYVWLIGSGLESNTSLVNNGTISNDGGTALSLKMDAENFTNNGTIRTRTGESGVFTRDTAPVNTGTIDNGVDSTLLFSGGLLQTAGQTIVNGVITIAAGHALTLNGGTLSGTGTIIGDVVNNGGTISMGNSPGTMNISGNYAQGVGGTMLVEIASASVFDVLNVTGTATLGGTLNVVFLNGYLPSSSMSFDFLSAGGGIVGAFDTLTYSAPGVQVAYVTQGGVGRLIVTGAPAAPEPSSVALLVFGGVALTVVVKTCRAGRPLNAC